MHTNRASVTGALGVLAMALSACAATQPFHPTEKATAESPEGVLAADYELRTDDGRVFGEGRVWSNGAEEAEVGGEDRYVVNVGFLLENETDSPITFPSKMLTLEYTTNQGVAYRGVRPVVDPGTTTVPARARKRVDVAFELAPDLDPEDVTAFRVNWKVDHREGGFSEATNFLQTQPTYVPAGYPIYDYYWYSPAHHRRWR